MSKSIMQPRNRSYCYLCNLLYGDDSYKYTEEHHVFGGPLKKLAEHYGLKVNLCIYHHRESKEAVHMNIEMNRKLQAIAQQVFEEKHPNLSFIGIFGRNYVA